jgi:hypothetical protein
MTTTQADDSGEAWIDRQRELDREAVYQAVTLEAARIQSAKKNDIMGELIGPIILISVISLVVYPPVFIVVWVALLPIYAVWSIISEEVRKNREKKERYRANYATRAEVEETPSTERLPPASWPGEVPAIHVVGDR